LFSDDEHSDRQPERDRHVCIFLHTSVSRPKEDVRYVTWQHLWSIRVPHLADE